MEVHRVPRVTRLVGPRRSLANMRLSSPFPKPPGLAGAVLALVALALAARLCAGQSDLRWHWSNPLPHGGTVVDMAYSPELLLGIQVAERGQIYTSSDLDLWLARDSATTDALRAVAFFGPTRRILVTGENGRVLYADTPERFDPGVLDVATGDWLEAVAVSPTLAVAAGDNGCVYTTANGVHWKRQSTGFTNWLRGVAYGDGVFVVVGTTGRIARSTNGIAWSKISSGTTQHLNRVAYAGDRFHAVGNAGVSLVSLNLGLSWQPDSIGATNPLEYAVSSTSNRLAVGVHEVWIKGQTGPWSNQLARAIGPPDWTYYSCIGRPGFFLTAGRTGLQAEWYATNGPPGFWLTPYDSVRHWLWDTTWLAGLYVAVGDFGTILTSGNGVDWTLELVPPAVTNRTLLGVGGTTNLLLAVGEAGTVLRSTASARSEPGSVTSGSGGPVGVIWTAIDPPTTHDLQGVGVLRNSLYVLTGDKGTVLVSPDGLTWHKQTTPTTRLLSSVTEWPGGLVATGDDGTIITSPDGYHWTACADVPHTTNWLYRVRYLNGILVTVGQNGTLLTTSSNGCVWTPHATGTGNWLTDVAFVAGAWYVTGHSGTLLTSTNLDTWTSIGTLTRNSIYAAATDSRQLIAVGVEGSILRSQVVPDLTPIAILDYDRVPGTNGNPAANVFLFAGHIDQRFTLDRCPALATNCWAPSATLEITDGSGALYYVETIPGTNLPPREFYRASFEWLP